MQGTGHAAGKSAHGVLNDHRGGTGVALEERNYSPLPVRAISQAVSPSSRESIGVIQARAPCRPVRSARSCRGSARPCASDCANFVACSAVTFGGIGGSNGSTTASTITGPGSRAPGPARRRSSAGSSIVKPVAPHARANAAKSIGCRSHPYSGLPRNTICSHLIMPERVVLHDHDLDRQFVLHAIGELGHQHREAAVAHEGDDCRSG